MPFMNTTDIVPIANSKKRGHQLTKKEKDQLIAQLVELLSKGYYSTNYLAKELGVSRATIDKYRETVDMIFANNKRDRNTVRQLQVERTYNIIERLTSDLDLCHNIKDKGIIYGQIAKFSQHLALIMGLNVETHVSVNHKQLVIIRANNDKRPVIEHSNSD